MLHVQLYAKSEPRPAFGLQSNQGLCEGQGPNPETFTHRPLSPPGRRQKRRNVGHRKKQRKERQNPRKPNNRITFGNPCSIEQKKIERGESLASR